MATTSRVLTDQMIEAIKAYIPRYPSRRAVVLPALHVVHEQLRQVPHGAVVEIADLLELPPAEVQDTLTFYGFFHQDQPHGQTRAWVCRSISCALRGGEEILEHLCARTGIRPGETTADGSLTVEAAECLGGCDFAPCMLADGKLHKELTKAKMDEFLRHQGVPGIAESGNNG